MFILNWFYSWTNDTAVVVVLKPGSMLSAKHVRRKIKRR